MKLSQKTTDTILNDILKPIAQGSGETPDYMCIEMIESEIKEDCSNLLNDFFQSKSDANKYLTASQQESIENDFKNWVLNRA